MQLWPGFWAVVVFRLWDGFGFESGEGDCYIFVFCFYRLLCSCIRPLKYIYNITFTVQGIENFNIKHSYVIVCNHQTNFDLLAMAEILPERCVPITKKELLYWGPLGFSGWLCNLVFIDRKKKHQARDTLEHLLRVWVYPEGTRNREDTMLPFKRGAFHLAIKAQVPIVPIVISSYTDFYSVKDKRFDPGKSKWQRTMPRFIFLIAINCSVLCKFRKFGALRLVDFNSQNSSSSHVSWEFWELKSTSLKAVKFEDPWFRQK
uniref:1-acyl-sn-glycerol-3-phosphate acyltransferase n=1 Tax=Naja naja TaxID=35670 RepID=A0A8C6VMU0_NAJNA